MKSRKVYFENVPNIGDLKIDEVFFDFEYVPILFSCIDNNNNLYLCVCAEIRKTQQWVISPISSKLLIEMLQDKITIFQAFELSYNSKIFAEYSKDSGITYKSIEFQGLDLLLLPEKDEYLEDEESFVEYINSLNDNYQTISLNYSISDNGGNNEDIDISIKNKCEYYAINDEKIIIKKRN